MTNLNHGILNKLPLLIPPVAEQHRIVSKVDELMVICDTLKKQIYTAQITQLKYAKSITEHALA